jgi:hypothetical protein
MKTLNIFAATAVAFALFACAAGSGEGDETTEGELGRRSLAQEGQTCGNGTFGTPNIQCARGLECAYPSSTAPTGPSGGSSARAGKCEKVAQAGETCGNGTFGTPNIRCASGLGLECVFPSNTAPTGPAGASSARAGSCEKRAQKGEQCADGVFGTPTIKCATGLECTYPNGTAPAGPPGASSARTGICDTAAVDAGGPAEPDPASDTTE